MAASHSLSRDKEWAENAPNCGAQRVPSLLRHRTGSGRGNLLVPRPWIFHPGKSTRLKLIRSAPQRGAGRGDEEKRRLLHFFSLSSLQLPYGAREHRKPCGLAPKGARGFARVACGTWMCRRATAETQGAKHSASSAPAGRPFFRPFLWARKERGPPPREGGGITHGRESNNARAAAEARSH